QIAGVTQLYGLGDVRAQFGKGEQHSYLVGEALQDHLGESAEGAEFLALEVDHADDGVVILQQDGNRYLALDGESEQPSEVRFLTYVVDYDGPLFPDGPAAHRLVDFDDQSNIFGSVAVDDFKTFFVVEADLRRGKLYVFQIMQRSEHLLQRQLDDIRVFAVGEY